MFESIYTQEQLQRGNRRHESELESYCENHSSPSLRRAQIALGGTALGLGVTEFGYHVIDGVKNAYHGFAGTPYTPKPTLDHLSAYFHLPHGTTGAVIAGLSLATALLIMYDDWKSSNSKPYKGAADSRQ